jgi:dethiobiotin synthetase
MSRARGLFVTGTDTGVGKTFVACSLVRALRRRGLDAGAMKPVETGVGPEGPLDARALRDAAGADDPLELVCPAALPLAAAPSAAARAAGRALRLDVLRAAFERLAARHELLVVEGAGGLLVPLAPGLDNAELARALGLPLLVVARASLGTINHTRLTLEAARARGLGVLGVVVSHSSGPLPPAELANLEELRRELADDLLGELPPLPTGKEPGEEALGIDALLARLAAR